jgi:hypothetical protein
MTLLLATSFDADFEAIASVSSRSSCWQHCGYRCCSWGTADHRRQQTARPAGAGHQLVIRARSRPASAM